MTPDATNIPPPPEAVNDCHACDEYNRLSRRRFMAWSGMAAAAAYTAPAWMPRVVFARDFSSRDVVVSIFLRGASDGLTMCVPYGDPAYYTHRPLPTGTVPGNLGIAQPGATNGCIALNGFFGLPPAMTALQQIYTNGHLAIVHATGSTDPSRSHFDAQKYMEIGKPADQSLFTGWLGRHIASVSPADPTATVRAIGIGHQLQLTLQGSLKGAPVPDLAAYTLSGNSNSLTNRLASLSGIYAQVPDPVRSASQNTVATIAALATVGAGTYNPTVSPPYPPISGTGASSFAKALKQTAALIAADIGVEAVAIDKSGWDTHSAQGNLTGTMAGHMADLANSIRAFYEDVIVNKQKNVTIVIMSEFGRRVAQNGSLGTDHGHGNVIFAIGRKINGGQVYGTWPGLSAGQLYQNLDVQVTTDFRDILAEIVQKRLANSNLASVFPGYNPTFRNIAVAG